MFLITVWRRDQNRLCFYLLYLCKSLKFKLPVLVGLLFVTYLRFVSSSFLYWLDAGIKPRIESCSLSGKGRRVLLDLKDQYPSILELDVQTQALYWNDKNTKQLFTARMDGSSMKVLKSSIPHITGIFIEGLYRPVGNRFYAELKYEWQNFKF